MRTAYILNTKTQELVSGPGELRELALMLKEDLRKENKQALVKVVGSEYQVLTTQQVAVKKGRTTSYRTEYIPAFIVSHVEPRIEKVVVKTTVQLHKTFGRAATVGTLRTGAFTARLIFGMTCFVLDRALGYKKF